VARDSARAVHPAGAGQRAGCDRFLRVITGRCQSGVRTALIAIALTVFFSLIGVITFGTLVGSLRCRSSCAAPFDPAPLSAPFVATLVDVTASSSTSRWRSFLSGTAAVAATPRHPRATCRRCRRW
jgi:hypothetical protein